MAVNGYRYVILCRGKQRKPFKIHRLVALVFLENPYDLPEINHIDEVKTNNILNNLEWISSKDNKKHSLLSHRNGWDLKKIRVRNIGAGITYDSLREASKVTGESERVISTHINGKIYKIDTRWEIDRE
jgi:hypothetical protein